MTKGAPPRLTIPEPDWSPGPPGTHELGEFVVPGPASLFTRGWLEADEPVRSDLDPRDLGGDLVKLSLRPGTWRGRLIVQPEVVPAELARELAQHPDGGYLSSVFTVTHRRPWLVLAHTDLGAGVPRPTEPVSVAALRREEDLAATPFDVDTDHGPIGLTCVGRPEPWVHRVAVVLGDTSDEGARAALAGVGWESLVSVWDWGVLFLCGRDGSFAVMAGGPASAHTVVALPGRV
ncbi:MAG: hypothetical protein U0325_30180 [Polyangiales bacterium]